MRLHLVLIFCKITLKYSTLDVMQFLLGWRNLRKTVGRWVEGLDRLNMEICTFSDEISTFYISSSIFIKVFPRLRKSRYFHVVLSKIIVKPFHKILFYSSAGNGYKYLLTSWYKFFVLWTKHFGLFTKGKKCVCTVA